jgi:hypothetical protein
MHMYTASLSGTRSHPRVESHWGLYLTNGIPNPAPDDATCLRKAPTREALSALGIWKLGSPESQLADHLLVGMIAVVLAGCGSDPQSTSEKWFTELTLVMDGFEESSNTANDHIKSAKTVQKLDVEAGTSRRFNSLRTAPPLVPVDFDQRRGDALLLRLLEYWLHPQL